MEPRSTRGTFFFLTEEFLFVVATCIVPSSFNLVIIELHAVLILVATGLAGKPIGVLNQRSGDPPPLPLLSSIASADPDTTIAFLLCAPILFRQQSLRLVVQNDGQLCAIGLTYETREMPRQFLLVQSVLCGTIRGGRGGGHGGRRRSGHMGTESASHWDGQTFSVARAGALHDVPLLPVRTRFSLD